MVSFVTYLSEAAGTTHAADVNEISLAYYLAGKDWNLVDDSKVVRARLKEKKSKISKFAAQHQMEAASRMANEVLRWAKENDYGTNVVRVFWIGSWGPSKIQQAVGDAGTVDKENPSDVLIQFKDGKNVKYLGCSAKSTYKGEDVPFANPGLGTIEKNLDVPLKEIQVRAEKKFQKMFKLPAGMGQRKLKIRSKGSLKEKADIAGGRVLQKIRDVMFAKLEKLNDRNARAYLIKDWLKADAVVFPTYIKVTGTATSAKIEDPFANSKLDALNKGNFEFVPLGGNTIGVMADGNRVLKMRMKWESQAMASSIKASGESWK